MVMEKQGRGLCKEWTKLDNALPGTVISAVSHRFDPTRVAHRVAQWRDERERKTEKGREAQRLETKEIDPK
jgi:hypothetical protein